MSPSYRHGSVYVNIPLVMHPYSLASEQFNLQVTLFGLKKAIYPSTRYDDTMLILRPFLVGANQPINKVFFVTSMAQPIVHPQFSVITLFEEAIRDQLVMGLADVMLYGVCLKPENLDPYATLLCLPDDLIDSEPENADDVIQVLQEEILVPIQQLTLASILHSHHVDTDTVVDALTAWFRGMEKNRN